MTCLELENRALAPRRWINFCRRLEQQVLNPRSTLHPRVMRYHDVQNSNGTGPLFIVPGGRYLVKYSFSESPESPGSISVIDLGYDSVSDCNLVASVRLEANYDPWTQFTVLATPDGNGLSIFLSSM